MQPLRGTSRLELRSAAPAILPSAAVPKGRNISFGQQNPYVGRALFYVLRYGRPDGVTSAEELISGKTVPIKDPIAVPPHPTVVLYLPPK